MRSRSIRESITPAQWDWVAKRYREGYNLTELAALLGVSYITVRQTLIELGVPIRPKSIQKGWLELPLLAARRREVYELANDGLKGGQP